MADLLVRIMRLLGNNPTKSPRCATLSSISLWDQSSVFDSLIDTKPFQSFPASSAKKNPPKHKSPGWFRAAFPRWDQPKPALCSGKRWSRKSLSGLFIFLKFQSFYEPCEYRAARKTASPSVPRLRAQPGAVFSPVDTFSSEIGKSSRRFGAPLTRRRSEPP